MKILNPESSLRPNVKHRRRDRIPRVSRFDESDRMAFVATFLNISTFIVEYVTMELCSFAYIPWILDTWSSRTEFAMTRVYLELFGLLTLIKTVFEMGNISGFLFSWKLNCEKLIADGECLLRHTMRETASLITTS